jgi:hypothetical protein
MKRDTKPNAALLGAILLTGILAGTAHAQSTLVESGTSYLADLFGSGVSSPETLNVSWFVVENLNTSIYTYAYNVNNPAGDVGLNNNGTPTGVPESFNSFSISFNLAGFTGFFQATPPIGGTVQNNGNNGLTYSFPDVLPGQSSPLLAFQTSAAPALNNASAAGGTTPPGPWSTVLLNSPVPVPSVHTVPEPSTMALLGLTALGGLRRLFRRS